MVYSVRVEQSAGRWLGIVKVADKSKGDPTIRVLGDDPAKVLAEVQRIVLLEAPELSAVPRLTDLDA